MEEIWKDIEGYEGLYRVSNMGRVKSLERTRIPNCPSKFFKSAVVIERILKPGISSGYCRVALSKEGRCVEISVHRLVALSFIKNPENKPQINHINGIKTDNRAENLEWVTAKENRAHAIKSGLIDFSSFCKPVAQFSLDGEFIRIWDSSKLIERTLGIRHANIRACCNGERHKAGGFIWKDVIDCDL